MVITITKTNIITASSSWYFSIAYSKKFSNWLFSDERVSFLKQRINPKNKPQENNTFQLQVDAVLPADIEKVAFIILQKKALLKNCKDVHESDKLFAKLDGLEWLQRQIARYS